MKNPPDDFFREKLKDYSHKAPMGTWDKIESKLKRSNQFGWWKIAASFLLLAISGYLWWQGKTDSGQTEITYALPDNESTVPEHTKKNNDIPELAQEKIKDSSDSIHARMLELTSIKKRKTKKIQNTVTPLAQQSPLQISKQNNSALPEVSSSPKVIDASEESAIKTTGNQQYITLKFAMEETNAYLDKNTMEQATLDEKKSSTFKKLLKKANDLKINQDPFGDLREKKNEILALNFKNEKRGQNK